LRAVSAGIRGVFGVEVGRGCLQRFDGDRQAVLRLIRAHRFLLPPIPHLLLRLKVSIPGIVGVVFQDGLDGLPVFDETDDPHDSPTLRAGPVE